MRNEIIAPSTAAPADRLTLAASAVRGAGANDAMIPSSTTGLSGEVEPAAMGHGSPPGWCVADGV